MSQQDSFSANPQDIRITLGSLHGFHSEEYPIYCKDALRVAKQLSLFYQVTHQDRVVDPARIGCVVKPFLRWGLTSVPLPEPHPQRPLISILKHEYLDAHQGSHLLFHPHVLSEGGDEHTVRVRLVVLDSHHTRVITFGDSEPFIIMSRNLPSRDRLPTYLRQWQLPQAHAPGDTDEPPPPKQKRKNMLDDGVAQKRRRKNGTTDISYFDEATYSDSDMPQFFMFPNGKVLPSYHIYHLFSPASSTDTTSRSSSSHSSSHSSSSHDSPSRATNHDSLWHANHDAESTSPSSPPPSPSLSPSDSPPSPSSSSSSSSSSSAAASASSSSSSNFAFSPPVPRIHVPSLTLTHLPSPQPSPLPTVNPAPSLPEPSWPASHPVARPPHWSPLSNLELHSTPASFRLSPAQPNPSFFDWPDESEEKEKEKEKHSVHSATAPLSASSSSSSSS
eukprot:TRINITY_DN16049_c0_g1_i2.p1 TRINITY_DN16049_c0_g1~~TRINITY_DN16049_c0_g1_i2.p1  ORF type:complete len:446 (-),score=79.52 TRINITY_DN16049_c0_g1_i2:76-1413(-)